MRTDKLRHILAQTLTAGAKRGEPKRDPTPPAKDHDDPSVADAESLPPRSSPER